MLEVKKAGTQTCTHTCYIKLWLISTKIITVFT